MEALCKDGLQGQPMEQREQCELAQTLPSRERLRVGETSAQRLSTNGAQESSGIRGRRSQQAISPGHRPGYTASTVNAKERAEAFLQRLFFCPFRARSLSTFLPRAMPWADYFCPFGAFLITCES